MLEQITIKSEDTFFKKDTIFKFRKGVNLIVGDQGTGKSTLLNLIYKHSKSDVSLKGTGSILFLDFEKGTPRTKALNPNDTDGFMFGMHTRYISHGESNLLLIDDINKMKDRLVLLDEPDGNLSPRSIYSLIKIFNKAVKRNCQFVCAAHNPLIIEYYKEVLSLETLGWVKYEDFMESQKKVLKKKKKTIKTKPLKKRKR